MVCAEPWDGVQQGLSALEWNGDDDGDLGSNEGDEAESKVRLISNHSMCDFHGHQGVRLGWLCIALSSGALDSDFVALSCQTNLLNEPEITLFEYDIM